MDLGSVIEYLVVKSLARWLVARRQDRGNLGLTAWSKKGYYEQRKNFD